MPRVVFTADVPIALRPLLAREIRDWIASADSPAVGVKLESFEFDLVRRPWPVSPSDEITLVGPERESDAETLRSIVQGL